ncbi:uncharacterized protein LOC130974886 [Arachis stenosperma]|uniref:uncharacterized protein LOC130974886 n=1 Tax=Arachis stenosperma TaxID=217475 RepID=UPI0025AB5ECD|nr:uncharacterized protein LOC130974886 [Arachis stenosperma]
MRRNGCWRNQRTRTQKARPCHERPTRRPQADNPLLVTRDSYSAPLKILEYNARLPYPQKLHKAEKDKQFARFLDILKTLEIKIPFPEALEKIPSYAMFMKDILSHKRDWREAETILLTKECSAIIKRNLPEKLQDPGSFKLWIQEVKPTRIYLQLADGSVKVPSGVVEDVIVRVGPFTFPTNFVILDIEENRNAFIILERPFLAIGKTIIDVQKGVVTLRVGKDEFILKVVKAMQHPDPQKNA